MSARRIIFINTLAVLLVGIVAAPAMAQFTPRFSTKRKGPPPQWHVGIGGTVLNLGDHTNESWPVLDAAIPIFHLRLGVAVPLKGETLFLLPEVEGHIASTSGEYIEPLTQIRSEVATISQRGFAILLSLIRATSDRRTVWGAGLGYYLTKHNPTTPDQLTQLGLDFHKDPFMHIGVGAQMHVARAVAKIKENTSLMLEGRYKVSYMDGDVSGRRLLMSELLLTAYLAIK